MFVRQRQLDFLRGVAATYVVINHTRGTFYIGGERLLSAHPTMINKLTIAALQSTSLGVEMVMLFFVLSGFAMAHSIAHTSSVGRFYLKRVIRIWPPYLAATFFAYMIARYLGFDFKLLSVATYLSPLTKVTPQFWSLPYEVIFYALCPFIIANRWLLPIAALSTAVTVSIKGPMLNPWHSYPLNFLGNELLFFAIGSTAYQYFYSVPKVPIWVVPLALPAVWISERIGGGPNIGSILLMCALALLAIRNLPDNIPKWSNLGSFSYSIYIFHYAMLALLFSFVGKSANPMLWMVFVPPVICCSYLLYWFTERPCNLILGRIRTQRTTVPALTTHRAACLFWDPRDSDAV